MKNFLTHLIKFFLFFSAGFIILFAGVLFLNKLLVYNCDIEDDVMAVIAGDSHTMWSIDAGNINHVRNVSLNAESYLYTYAKLKYMFAQESNISKVYLGISYHNFAGYYDEYIYGRYLDFLLERYIGILDLKDYMVLVRNRPKNALKIPLIVVEDGSSNLVSGGCPIYGRFPSERMTDTLNREQIKLRIFGQFYRNEQVVPVSEINIVYLNKIIDLCRRNNVDITVLNTPLHFDYKKQIPSQYVSMYENFIADHHLKVYEFEDLSLPDSCYLPDGDHVNYYGALETTKKFKSYHENNFAKKQEKPDQAYLRH